LTYAIVKGMNLVKVPYFTLPNLLLEDPLVPEFLQKEAHPEALADSVRDLLNDPARRDLIAQRFARLRVDLARGADQRAAEAVMSLAIRDE